MKYERLALLLLPVLIVVKIVFSEPATIPIVNVHESVESVADVVRLQEAMKSLGIVETVLQAIPADLVTFNGKDLDLGGVEENNAALEQVELAYPEEFSYFCSIDPNDPLRIDKFEDCLTAGAKGVKLYNGYSYAHLTPIDDAKLNEFYSLLAEKGALLMLPVNTAKYEEELKNLLTLHPDLTVICSHFCLSSKDLDRLTALMNEFPNLYVDTSFGSIDFVEEGFQTISDNHDAYVAFFDTFQDRILFGTDVVITSYEDKSTEWITQLYSDYLSILQDGEFASAFPTSSAVYTGLELPTTIQNKVLYKNWNNLIQ